MTDAKKHRYKNSGGKRWIEVRVKEAQQLFDFRDPSPFRERDLDDDFIEYIMLSAREFSHKTPVKIVIYIGGKMTPELSKEAIHEALHSYLSYQIELSMKDLRSFLRRGQIFLLLGILMLVACLSIARAIPPETEFTAMSILREGVTIFGWVSMWKPIELLLFEWYPLFDKLRLYRKLLETEVDIHFEST